MHKNILWEENEKGCSFCNLILTPKDVNRHRFLKYTQILRNPTASEGCKNFSRGVGYTFWVSRRSTWIKAFERTYFHDHPMGRSKFFCEKLIFMQKKTFHIPF